MDIFEECKTDHIETFLKKYPETYDLTFEEVKTLKFLSEVANKLQVCFHMSPYNNFYQPCIFKSNNLWIVWQTNDRGTFCREKAFDNILDASKYLFDLLMEDLTILLKQEINEESINEFANLLIDFDYNITDLDTYKLKK